MLRCLMLPVSFSLLSLFGQVEPEALDQLMILIRNSLVDHIQLMQTPEYQEQLRRRVRLESARNKQLRERVRTLEAHVARLQREGLRMLAAGLHQCGIRADKPADFFLCGAAPYQAPQRAGLAGEGPGQGVRDSRGACCPAAAGRCLQGPIN